MQKLPTNRASYEGFCCTANKTPAMTAGVCFLSAAQDGRFLILAITDDGKNTFNARPGWPLLDPRHHRRWQK
jgi:hypothetical protein